MSQETIEAGLRSLGLTAGDVVLLHSSLSSLGNVAGGADTVVAAFLAVLGAEGTLVVPTFGNLGVMTEVVRGRPDAICSVHPLASVAAIGGRAAEICADHWQAETAHGQDTPYTRIAALHGYVCLLGVDQDRNTTLHTVEALLQAPYLKSVTRTFAVGDGEQTRTWSHFPGPHRDFIGIDQFLRRRGILRQTCIGQAVVRLMRSHDVIEALCELGRDDPAWALCDNPNCSDCVRQRAALRGARLAAEAATIAVSSQVAGYYVPEIADHLAGVGVTHVELDVLEGRPAHTWSPARLQAAAAELGERGCTITGLRCPGVSPELDGILAAAADSGIPRVVAPLSGAEQFVPAAAARGLSLSLYNTCESASFAGQRLQANDAALTFNAANFTRLGESPFSHSFRRVPWRRIDQLDIADCTYDGRPTALAGGNAEIKELISILRCRSFAGLLLLTSGSLRPTIEQFDTLLASI